MSLDHPAPTLRRRLLGFSMVESEIADSGARRPQRRDFHDRRIKSAAHDFAAHPLHA
jgi:hypothetical protein